MPATEKKIQGKATEGAPKQGPKSALSVHSKEFAVIATGGKQYIVSPGNVIKIEKMAGDHQEGGTLVFDKVLIVDNGTDTTIGTPFIEGAKVTGTLQRSARDKKVETIKYKQKSRYFIRRGHRQPFFLVKIESIR